MTKASYIPINAPTQFRKERKSPDWLTFLNDLTDFIDLEDKSEEVARHRKWERNIKFYRGHQIGYIPTQTGVFQDIPVPSNSTVRINNILRYFVDNIVKELVRSQASFTVAAKKDSIEAEGVARLVKAVIEDIQKREWTSSKKQAEAKYTILCGNSFRYSSYSYADSSQTFKVPKMEDEIVQEETTLHICPNCGAAAGEGDLPPSPSACEECGQEDEPIAINIPHIAVPKQVGYDEFPVGDVKVDIVDPMEIKMNLHSRSLEDSPYLRRSRMVSREFLENLYDWAEIYESVPDDTGLVTQAELERAPGNVANGNYVVTSGMNNRQARFDEYWIEPLLYGKYVFPVDTMMNDGSVVKAGTRALDLYPNGMYIAKSMKSYLEIKQGVKNNHWVHVVWNKSPSSIYGDGIDDAIEKQKQHNDAATLVHDNLMNNTAPPTYYNPLKVNRGQITAKPGYAVPLRNATPSDNPANYVFQMQPRQLGSEIHQTLQEQKGDMAMLVGGAFSSLSPGIGGANPSTATGLAIIRDSALSHLAPFLDLKGEADVKMVKQWLVLIKKYQLGDRVIYTSSDYVDLENRNFRAAHLEEDLDVNLRPGSLMPRTELERRNDVLEAMAAGGLPLGLFNPQMPHRLRMLLADRYNIPFDAYEGAADERIQQKEIEDLLNLAHEAEEAGVSYEEFALKASEVVFPKIYVDNHDIHIQFIVRWLKKDKGLKAHPYVQNYLNQHIKEHLAAKGQLAQEAQQLQMMGMGANPASMAPQNPEQALANQQPSEDEAANVQRMQELAARGGVSSDTRPTPIGQSLPGTKRVHGVTNRPHQSTAPQPD